jgi:hypothetical protein
MVKEEILTKLDAHVDDLVRTCEGAHKDAFFRYPGHGKWSVAGNVKHLILAVRPLNLAFSLPVLALRMFGVPSRNSFSYQELVDQYRDRLNRGAKASAPFIPRSRDEDKEVLIGELKESYSKLASKVRVLNEKSLDRYLLPHPILGRITIREMLYFTAYHVQHHHQIIIERLKQLR